MVFRLFKIPSDFDPRRLLLADKQIIDAPFDVALLLTVFVCSEVWVATSSIFNLIGIFLDSCFIADILWILNILEPVSVNKVLFHDLGDHV